jgi:DNA-binding response OmpR family regulator
MLETADRTILIVDDDAGVTETFERMLRIEGFDVRTASDAAAGLEIVDGCRVDAILLDLRMPIMDGIDFMRRLRARSQRGDLPVAIVTGDYFVDDGQIGALRELGAVLHFKPLWVDDLRAIAHRLLSSRGDSTPAPGRGDTRLNLLLVDDCVAERDLYEMSLATEFNIRTAGRGDEGVALAAAERPDAIVLDVMMPGMSGWEACMAIRCNATTATIPVILLTSLGDHDLPMRAMAVGATALLRKPCPTDQLKATILEAVQQGPRLNGSP